MIRANLLPRAKESVSAFGTELDLDHLRQALVGLAIVGAIVLLGMAIEALRLHRIVAAAQSAESYLAAEAPKRDAAKALALDVARYQEIAREEARERRTGAAAAVEIARIGNAVPARVWLDSLVHDTSGFEIAGGSRGVDAVGGTILGLGNSFPGRSAALVSIDNHNAGSGAVRFAAHLADATTPEREATP